VNTALEPKDHWSEWSKKIKYFDEAKAILDNKGKRFQQLFKGSKEKQI
jgi:hypothetical protein